MIGIVSTRPAVDTREETLCAHQLDLTNEKTTKSDTQKNCWIHLCRAISQSDLLPKLELTARPNDKCKRKVFELINRHIVFMRKLTHRLTKSTLVG